MEDSTVSFSNKLTEIIKLHQVCNGFTKNDDGKILQLHKSKLNALEETLEETDGKVIIWANYLYNIHEIKDFLINLVVFLTTFCFFMKFAFFILLTFVRILSFGGFSAFSFVGLCANSVVWPPGRNGPITLLFQVVVALDWHVLA